MYEVGKGLRNAISMREEADYGSVFSVEGARTTVSNAEGFLEEVKGILDSGGE